jgi:DNA ligase-1
MVKLFKPMLAGEADLENLRFPLLASAKLDGVRALRIGGRFMSRNMKPIPNRQLQESIVLDDGLDGELIAGKPTAKDCYRRTMSVVMSDDTEAESVRYYVFDTFDNPQEKYEWRRPVSVPHPKVTVLPQWKIKDLATLLLVEEKSLAEGYEGLMLRSLDGVYKNGRATTREGWLLKLKRFQDDEAYVIGFEEQERNDNEATTDALGRTARSSHQENKVGKNTLGSLIAVWKGKSFNIGTGFTDSERLHIWAHQSAYLGRQAKFKYLAVGMKNLPRHPVFLGWRTGD